jgi:hypothetical protein
VLRTQVEDVPAGEAAAFDRTLRARLDALGVVRTEGAVALDLEEAQLATGCMGETVECLTPIAEAQGTPLLVVPSLARAGDTTLVTVLVFDQRDGSIRRGVREQTGHELAALLAGVDGLLREVFGLPPAPLSDEAPVESAPPAASGLAPAPIVVIAVGAAALVGGAIAGSLSLSDASAVTSATPATPADVDALDPLVARQNAEALAADVLSIAGGVIAVGGLAWMLAAGRDDGGSPIAVAPIVSPTQVGLALAGRFGGVW